MILITAPLTKAAIELEAEASCNHGSLLFLKGGFQLQMHKIQSLLQNLSKKYLKSIKSSILELIFFDTPHCGSHKAAYREKLAL